jgi:hypothetical protein
MVDRHLRTTIERSFLSNARSADRRAKVKISLTFKREGQSLTPKEADKRTAKGFQA